MRGMAVAKLPQVKKGSWQSLLLDLGGEHLLRFPLGDPDREATQEEIAALCNADALAFVKTASQKT